MKSSKGDDWLDKKLEHAEPGEIVAGVRPDATFNRIDKHIRNAAMQLDAVNPKRDVPNVLVFVNNVLVLVNHDIRGVPLIAKRPSPGVFRQKMAAGSQRSHALRSERSGAFAALIYVFGLTPGGGQWRALSSIRGMNRTILHS